MQARLDAEAQENHDQHRQDAEQDAAIEQREAEDDER
jgi:hypothetical protein